MPGPKQLPAPPFPPPPLHLHPSIAVIVTLLSSSPSFCRSHTHCILALSGKIFIFSLKVWIFLCFNINTQRFKMPFGTQGRSHYWMEKLINSLRKIGANYCSFNIFMKMVLDIYIYLGVTMRFHLFRQVTDFLVIKKDNCVTKKKDFSSII